jgi:hypothetical protein
VLSPAAGRRPRHAGISPRSPPPIRWAARSPGLAPGAMRSFSGDYPPCVYDERPRLPVGLAVGAADQAPRACDRAGGLTGKERAISRFVAPGPRVRIHLPPAESHANPITPRSAAEKNLLHGQSGLRRECEVAHMALWSQRVSSDLSTRL